MSWLHFSSLFEELVAPDRWRFRVFYDDERCCEEEEEKEEEEVGYIINFSFVFFFSGCSESSRLAGWEGEGSGCRPSPGVPSRGRPVDDAKPTYQGG